MDQAFWIGMGFLIIGVALCAKGKPVGIPGVITGLIVLVVYIMVSGIQMASARDPDGRYANSPLKEWFDGLKSGKGPCCSDADGNVVKDADWQSSEGHFRVFIEDEWVAVDDDAVITVPNLFGRTMVWPIHKDGKPVVRCFMPGPMT